MSQAMHLLPVTFMAAANLSTKRFYLVVISAEQTVNLAGAAASGAYPLQNDPDAAGEDALVEMKGTSKVVAGAAFAAGARITPNGSAQAITATTGQPFCGRALEAATAANDIVEYVIEHGVMP